jgi:hypothetical protein
MKARFEGRFALRGDCLTFEGSGIVYLPVVARATPVSVFPDRVEIGGRSHRFGDETVIVGGAQDSSAAGILVERPPAQCAWPLLRVSGIR